MEDKAWVDYRERFAHVYDDANYASPLQAFVMRASHKLVEKDFGPQSEFPRVLEVGAGTGEHMRFVRHRFDEYILSDLDAVALDVARKKLAGRHEGRLEFEAHAGTNFDYADASFDRVVAVHVLEHIPQPHIAIKEWRRLLKPGGVLSVLLPTDPGLAWRLGRHLGPRRRAIAQGIAYDYVMAREHVNSCNNLVALLRHYFPGATEAWWPMRVPSVDLNLFVSLHAVA